MFRSTAGSVKREFRATRCGPLPGLASCRRSPRKVLQVIDEQAPKVTHRRVVVCKMAKDGVPPDKFVGHGIAVGERHKPDAQDAQAAYRLLGRNRRVKERCGAGALQRHRVPAGIDRRHEGLWVVDHDVTVPSDVRQDRPDVAPRQKLVLRAREPPLVEGQGPGIREGKIGQMPRTPGRVHGEEAEEDRAQDPAPRSYDTHPPRKGGAQGEGGQKDPRRVGPPGCRLRHRPEPQRYDKEDPG